MRKLAKYLKPYWIAVIFAPLSMMIEVFTELMQPKLMASIVDDGVANGNISFIVKTSIIMIGIALIGVLGGICATIFSSKASHNFGADLKIDLFGKIQSFSFDALDKFSTASLVTRLTDDVVQVQTVVLFMLRMLVRAPLLCFGGIVMAFTLNLRMSLILLVAVPLLAISVWLVIRKAFPLFSEVQKRLDKVNTVMQENLSGIRVVKAFVRSDYENKRFASANEKLAEITIKAARIVGFNMPIMSLIMNASVIAVIWFGGIKVNTGDMLVGEVMAYITYITQILFSLMMMTFIFNMISSAKASADRIIEVLDTESGVEETLIKTASESMDVTEYITENIAKEITEDITVRKLKGRIEFDDVSFKYEGASGDPILKHISFTAMEGETIGIIGPTGSGKSTLVNLIPGFYDVTEGKISIDGIDIKDIDIEELRESIGMVLQESILFTGTIKDNISWGREDASEEDIIEAAKAAQAHNFITQFPDGYDTILGQRGVNLSGGQKQRISIARALLKKPEILILDDSTSAVDMETEARIQAALKELIENSTCFIIAQRISSVMDADKIIVLEDGNIVNMGTHLELLKSCRIYRGIYDSQLGGRMVSYGS